MQVLAIEKPLQPIDPSKHAELLRAEALKVWTLKKQGILREIWFTRPDRAAVLLLEVDHLQYAADAIAGLPLAKAGLISFDFHELAPYDGFDRLLKR